MPTKESYFNEMFVIGIGASSGEEEAIADLISGLSYLPESFILIILQYDKTFLVDKLNISSNGLDFVHVVDGAILQKNSVYICPPDTLILLKDQKLEVVNDGSATRLDLGNLFFASLASETKNNAIALFLDQEKVLSCQDGIAAIKAVGGHNYAFNVKGLIDSNIDLVSTKHLGKEIVKLICSINRTLKNGILETALIEKEESIKELKKELDKIRKQSYNPVVGGFLAESNEEGNIFDHFFGEKIYLLFKESAMPMWILDADTFQFLEVNDAASEKFGYSKEELISMKITDLGKDHSKFTEFFAQGNFNEHVFIKDSKYQHKNGSIFYFDILISCFRHRKKRIAVAVLTDVTGKVLTHKILVDKNREIDNILKSITDGLFVCNMEWEVTYWSPEKSLSNQSLEIKDWTGKKLWDVCPDLQLEKKCEEVFLEKKPVVFQKFSYSLKKWFEVSIYPFEKGFSLFYKDISLKKCKERLDAIGRSALEMNYKPGSMLEATMAFYLSEVEEVCKGVLLSVMVVRKDRLYNLAAPSFPKDCLQGFEGMPINDKEVSFSASVYRKKGIEVKDIGYDLSWEKKSPLISEMGLKSCWSYPIIGFDHSVLGVFIVFSKKPHLPSPEEKENIESVLSLITIAVQGKTADIEIRRSKERYEMIAKATHDTIWDWDLQTQEVYRTFNSFNKLFGYEREDLNKNKALWEEAVHPKDFKRVTRKLKHTLKDTSKGYWEDEFRFRKHNGEYAFVAEKGYIIRNEKGEAVRLIGSTQDITEKKKVEDELLKLSLIAKRTENSVIITDLEGRIVWVNEAFKKVTGYGFDEVKGKKPGNLLQGKDTNPATVEYMRQQVKKRSSFLCEIINYNNFGQSYWVKIQAQCIKDNHGQPQFFFAIQTDITRQKEEESLLKLLGSVITNTNDAIVIAEVNKISDKSLQVVYANTAFLDLTGLDQKDVIGYEYLDLYLKKTTRSVVNRLRKSIKESNVFVGEVKYKRANGKEAIFEMRVFPIRDGEGATTHFVSIQKDITRSEKMKFYLQMAFKRLHFHIENTTLATIQWDMELHVKSWSIQSEQILGWKKSEAIGKKVGDLQLIHEDDLLSLQNKFNEALEGKENTSFDFTARAITKKNTILYTEWHNSLLFDENGEFLSFLSLVKDVTTTKLAEKAIVEGQEEERKRIAREIHDGIGQMLIALKYKISSFNYGSENDHIHMIEELDELMKQTIDEVRMVSHNLAPRSLEEVGIEVAVRDLCNQVRSLTGLNVVFQYIGEGYKADRSVVSTMFRITQEALNNAIKHSGANNVKVTIAQSLKSLTLSFEDNGKGFVVDHKPFIKGDGLKNMEERAKLLNGLFQLRSSPGEGTNIFVSLPLKF